MKQGIGTEIRQFTLIIIASTLTGAYFGYPWTVIGIATGLYFIWSLMQLQKLLKWLHHEPEQMPPDSTGVWNHLFERIYKIQSLNISTRRRLHAALNRTRESTSALKDGVVLLDNKSRISWWNQAAEAFLGLQKGADEGQVLTNLLRDPRLVNYFEKASFDEPLELKSPINETLRLQLSVTIFGEGEHLIFCRNITRLHNLEQMRQDFVANVSHELRTPLTVIVGYLETLLEHHDDIDKASRHILKEMQKQSSRMNALVQDLLLLSRLGTTSVVFSDEPIDIGNMLRTIENEVRQFLPEKKHRISLAIDTDVKLLGNEQELHSAFSNLVLNAIKYTPEQGKIDIRWWQNNQGLHFSVSDNGIGIDPKHIPRLTERFYRVDKGRSVATGGTGLGLAIVKHVMLRHNGYLDIESKPSNGSQFTCHFPSSQAP